jgi:hypothetical protein
MKILHVSHLALRRVCYADCGNPAIQVKLPSHLGLTEGLSIGYRSIMIEAVRLPDMVQHSLGLSFRSFQALIPTV